MRLIKRLAAVILCAALVIAVPACAAGTGRDADVEKQLKLIVDNAEEWWYVYGRGTEVAPTASFGSSGSPWGLNGMQ